MDRRKIDKGRIKPRIVLVTPVIEDADDFAPKLAAASGGADIASVILRLAPARDTDPDGRTAEWDLSARIRTLAPAVQESGVAVILDGLLHLIVSTVVDGVHLNDARSIQSVRPILKDNRIVGAGGLLSRHDAMTAGDAGADYVMFGEPDAAGRRPSLPALAERVTWWAELFELPCVAYAARLDEIATLVQAGADFIAVGDELIWNAPEGPAVALAAAAIHLDLAETVQ
jgi:thiamine-phosphate pyrophosphorylase